jgi:N-acetyl-anhydromuramyl-L-alanine amidase AmpD
VANAKVELEGKGLSATTNKFGQATLDVSSLETGDYVLALTPDAANLLRSTSDPVGVCDGNKTDAAGTCRYRPLKIQISLTRKDGVVQLSDACPHGGAVHGAAFVELTNKLLIDWKPDWIACKNAGARPKKVSPSIVLLHRTGGGSPGSAIDEFISTAKSSHYLVDVDGHVIKLVHEDLVANHAGKSWWNSLKRLGEHSVGIEIVNQAGAFTGAQYDAVIRLIEELQRNYPDITRHRILAHGEVRVVSETNLTLAERAGCPGVHFDWPQLESRNLASKADPALFQESQLDGEYGGYFKDKPKGVLSYLTSDAKLVRKDKTPYGVIASLQADLFSLGYSINASDGVTPTGSYDNATQAAVDRFRRRYMPGVVHSNERLDPTFDRATAIALKRAVLDHQR